MTPGRRRRWRPVLAWVLVVVLAAGAGLAGSVLLVGLRLTRPATREAGPVPAVLAGAETVSFPAADGSEVRGWWLAGRSGGGAVLLAHPVWESRLTMVRRARVLHEAGFGTLLIDLQAHGESPGRRITFGAREGADIAAAADFIRRRAPGERVGVVGVSLGGAAAVLAPGDRADAVVLESVYPTIDAALANRLRENLPAGLGFVLPVLSPVFKLMMPLVIGVSPDDLRPIDRIGKLGAPLLLLAGTRDARTPPAEARALFDAAREPKRFHPVEGAAHEDLERFDPDAYWAVVLPFLTGALR